MNILKIERIDELTLELHNQLSKGDTCFYLGSYDPSNDSYDNKVKSLIHNLKKTKGQSGYQYKTESIKYLAQYLSKKYQINTLLSPHRPQKLKLLSITMQS